MQLQKMRFLSNYLSTWHARPVISSDIDTIKSIMGSNVLYASNSADYKKNIELLIPKS